VRRECTSLRSAFTDSSRGSTAEASVKEADSRDADDELWRATAAVKAGTPVLTLPAVLAA